MDVSGCGRRLLCMLKILSCRGPECRLDAFLHPRIQCSSTLSQIQAGPPLSGVVEWRVLLASSTSAARFHNRDVGVGASYGRKLGPRHVQGASCAT